MEKSHLERVAEALDEARSRLLQGESIEQCLAAHRELEGELRPLLALACSLQRLAAAQPESTAQLAAGRERFLGRAEQMRIPSHFSRTALGPSTPPRASARRGPAGPLFSLLRRGIAAAAVMATLLVAVLGGSTMMASASSLPGDPLYPVKRAAESVQLVLTFDEQSRASMQQTFEQRRLEETRAVVQRRRKAQVSFSGVVQSFEGSTLVAAGLTVAVEPATRLTGSPGTGQVVAVVAVSQPDGRLLAEQIETLEPTLVPVKPTRRPKAHTPTRAATATATPTARPTAEPNLEPTAQVAPTATAALTATLVAEPPLPPTVVLTDTAAPQPTLAVTPTLEATIWLTGTIEQITPERWRIGAQEVRVAADTRLDEREGKAEAGALVRVEAVRDLEGDLLARQIVVELGAGKETFLEGPIEAVAEKQWTVAGTAIEILPGTAVGGKPSVGSVAIVQAHEAQGGLLVAIQIAVFEAQPESEVCAGEIQEMAADHWTVGGRTVRLDPQTLIFGPVAVGRRVKILGLAEPDGAIRALALHIDGYGAPSPTPPSEPLPLPSATPATPLPED